VREEGSVKPGQRSPAPWIGYETTGCIMGSWKNITIAVWARQGTVELVGELARVSAEYTKRDADTKVSTVHMILNHAPLPDTPTRNALRALSELYAPKLACVGTMIEGAGFWAGAVRGLVTSLQIVAPRRSFRMHICGSTNALASWMAEPHTRETGVSVEPSELEAMLNGLLARPSIMSARRE
jgi:hypothetical protein